MENMEENSEQIGNIWKESKLNSEKIGKIQQSVYSPPPRQTTWKNISRRKISRIVKKYEKYGRKQRKHSGNMEEK